MPKRSSQSDNNRSGGKSPSILRIFPVVRLLNANRKILWIHGLSTFLFIALVLVGYDTYRNVQIKQDLFSLRKRVEVEKIYWEKIITVHKNYRDGYYRLALLEYTLGNSDKAYQYVTKALQIDPNFIAGKVFAEKIVNKKS